MFIYGLFNKQCISLSLLKGMLGVLTSYEIDKGVRVEGRRCDETQELP